MTIGGFLAAEAWRLVLMGVLLAGSAFFAAAETALFSLSRGQLHQMSRQSHRLVRLVPALMRRPGAVLTTVLLGTNVLHILYFVSSSLLVIRLERGVAGGEMYGAAAAVTTLLVMVLLGEIVPKALASVWAAPLAPLAALVLGTLGRCIGPIQRGLMAFVVEPLTRLLGPARAERTGLSTDELAALLTLSQKRGLIAEDQSEILQEVLELTDLRAADIMVPRVDLVAHEISEPTEALVQTVRERRITKIPVYEKDLDHIVGLVYAKHLLVDPHRPVRELLMPVQFVPVSAPLERVLTQFRASRTQLAIVVDEYGGTAGLITLEDVLEEVVGDIADAREPRTPPAVVEVGPGEWLVDGDLGIHEWAQAFPAELSGARFSTVGGFVISLLGHIPTPGETVTYHNVSFTVEAMGRRRITRLRVRLREDGS